jgi:hypothetical protein
MKGNWKKTAAGLALVFGLSGGAFAQTISPREGRPVARPGSVNVQNVADHNDHRGVRPDDRNRRDGDRDRRWVDNGRSNWDRDHNQLKFDRDRDHDRDQRYPYVNPRAPWLGYLLHR